MGTIVKGDLGTVSAASAPVSMDLTPVTVPAGATIFVTVMEKSVSRGSVSDSAGNIYFHILEQAPNNNTANGLLQTYYTVNVYPMVGGTITYAKNTPPNFCCMSAMYVTGVYRVADNFDGNASNLTFGNSTTPSVTSFGPSLFDSGELVVGAVGWSTTTNDTFTQDSVNGAYSTPPAFFLSTSGQAAIAGGSLVRTGTAPITYAPTIGASNPWAAIFQSFIPEPPQSPLIKVYSLGTASGTAGATVDLPGVTVPAGSTIFVAAYEKNTTSGGPGTFADSVGNSYPLINDSSIGTVTNGHATNNYASNSLALNNGTITYTKRVSGVFTSLVALYVTGLRKNSPLDQNSTAQNFASSATPNSGNIFPTVGGQLIIETVFWVAGGGDIFTQPSTWSSPPDVTINAGSAAGIAGAYFVMPTAYSSVIRPNYNPLLNNVRSWGVFSQTFFAATPEPGHDDTSLGVNDA